MVPISSAAFFLIELTNANNVVFAACYNTFLLLVFATLSWFQTETFTCDGILLLHPAKCIHQFSRASDLVYFLFRLLAKDGPWWFLQENKKTEVGDMKLYS